MKNRQSTMKTSLDEAKSFDEKTQFVFGSFPS
jgi:hypothetical protein